jgi:hypothetical protein
VVAPDRRALRVVQVPLDVLRILYHFVALHALRRFDRTGRYSYREVAYLFNEILLNGIGAAGRSPTPAPAEDLPAGAEH